MEISQFTQELENNISGEIYTDQTYKIAYATDASSYREYPLAVIIPKNKHDIQKIVKKAYSENIPIIPRAAGTSLAGQVVGKGVIIDISKYLNKIEEINIDEHWVRVQPGVNLSELNKRLETYGFQFGPETSTANRCCIGGMFGNNSCGAHSMIYGSTREHVIEVETILSDGSIAKFGSISKEKFIEKVDQQSTKLESKIYKHIHKLLSSKKNRDLIRKNYPESDVERRNMGYALDILMDSTPFENSEKQFNFCQLLAGSEGTLAVTTSLKLNIIPLPPSTIGIIAAHFKNIEESLKANIIAQKYTPASIEMIDNKIIECTKEIPAQIPNRFFIKGSPEIILFIEFYCNSQEELHSKYQKLVNELSCEKLGFHFPLIENKQEISKMWDLRRAGLGSLGNIPGDTRSTTVIEDTAISVYKLPEYIQDFKKVLKSHNLSCVYYAHVGSGELHLRPLINLKTEKGQILYKTIAQEIASLVKKHKGSLSGEHGDGRLRGSFIPYMYGEDVFNMFVDLKASWDPKKILNPNKIINVPPITDQLRFETRNNYTDPHVISSYQESLGFIRAVERCNGSGDCRKSAMIGGTMCPTYMATKDETMTTRGRANLLREFLHHNNTTQDRIDHKELYQILDQCISCKACKTECPAGVDMAKYKAEFLSLYYQYHTPSLRTKAIAYLPTISPFIATLPRISNWIMRQSFIKEWMSIHPYRDMPPFNHLTLTQKIRKQKTPSSKIIKTVYLFADEFTNYMDSEIGLKCNKLLNRLGYKVKIAPIKVSGRTFISKGILDKAKRIAIENIAKLSDLISYDKPLIGIEPSTILSLRDEYKDLIPKEMQNTLNYISENALLFEEFFIREVNSGNITMDQFSDIHHKILYHGHCQQKAIAGVENTLQMLSFPKNYTVSIINTGCCGMAGSFGYEKEHYELSQKIGELKLFPSIRASSQDTIISASGTSCRHQIKDGTKRQALHPIEVMFEALR